MKKRTLFLALLPLFALSCKPKQVLEPVIPISDKALNDPSSVYYGNFAEYPKQLKDLPIGLFDSGTGGLTVFERFLSCDEFDNATGMPGGDGIPDFIGENFQYLADDANMPYGNYAAEDKTDFLRETVVRDALFLLGNKYYASRDDEARTGKKEPVKIIVIACNTATAYGLGDIETLLERSKTGVKVIGVINAAVNAALEGLQPDADYAIGVLATPGTISSGAYERTMKEIGTEKGFTGDLIVISQPGYGFAESVDGIKEYVLPGQKTIRADYRGPALGEGEKNIDPALMAVYNFDPAGLLKGKDAEKKDQIQLNSSVNYARYNLVSLFEKYRQLGGYLPMKSVILGCTHYPFLLETLWQVVEELRAYNVDGVYPYRPLIADDFRFIDPALFTAKECYAELHKTNNLRKAEGAPATLAPFISVPAKWLAPENLDADGTLAYAFKYGRFPGTEDITTQIVPFSRENLGEDVLARLQRLVPLSYGLIEASMAK